MEHSYSKDVLPKDNVEVIATRTILIPRPPQCPSCHHNSSNDDVVTKMEHTNDTFFEHMPPAINDNIAKMAMEETERLTKNVKNHNVEDDDWDLKINKFGWTRQQLNLYQIFTKILDYDQLARLAVHGRPNEGLLRRCSVDKSVARMRTALSAIQWDIRITQWIHGLMIDNLPPSYMTSYLDILQAMRAKIPTLVDKMISGRPLHQDYLQVISKRPWGANVPTKQRKLPGQSPVIVIIPSSFSSSTNQPSSRLKRWYALLNTMTNVVPIQFSPRPGQALESISEQVVGITRAKIQELRSDLPNRHIILVGINAGASLALQVALVENVSSIVCMGYAFNTINGVRGAPDDKILEITTPILFVLGENSAKSSQEEIESLRERMAAQTSLVVVGSADDALRIGKFRRHIEGISQSMVDNMIADEMQDFVSTCIVNPPGPRDVSSHLQKKISLNATKTKGKKRKITDENKDKIPRKVGRPRLNRPNEMPTGKYKPERPKPTSALLKQSNETLKMAIQGGVPSAEAELITAALNESEITPITPVASIPTEPFILSTSNIQNTEIISAYEIVSTPESSLQTTFQPIGTPTTTVVTAMAASPNTVTPTMVTAAVTQSASIVAAAGKLVQSKGQFVQLKPPTSTGLIQAPSVQNFFMRKGTEKSKPGQPFYTVRTQPIVTSNVTTTTPATANQIPSNKKIIVKSQQIISPGTSLSAANIKKLTSLPGQAITTIDPTTISADLTSILDLPIIFADNEGNLQDQQANAAAIIATPISQIQIPTTIETTAGTVVTSTTPNHIILTSNDGKIQNRQVVISAANMAKLTKPNNASSPPNNKLIFINRSQIKNSTTSITATPPNMQTVKQMPPLKLVSSSSPIVSASPSSQQSTTFTKLAPGTKIDLSTLKIIKTSPNVSQPSIISPKPLVFNIDTKGKKTTTTSPVTLSAGNIITTKPLFYNVDSVKTTPSPSKNTIVLKSAPTKTETTINPMGHQVLKTGLLNRNITVRKVMNFVPNKTGGMTGIPAMSSDGATSIARVGTIGRKDGTAVSGGNIVISNTIKSQVSEAKTTTTTMSKK